MSRVAVILPLSILVTFLIAAAIDGNLTQGSITSILCNDLSLYLNTTHEFCSRPETSSIISALRDIPLLTTIVAVSLTIPLMYSQWTSIESLLEKMDSSEVLSFPTGRATVEQAVQRCNDFFTRASKLNALVSCFALICVLLVHRSLAVDPVYPVLGAQTIQGVPPENWWASPVGGLWAGILYVLWGTIIVNIIVLQNIHGSRVVYLLWETRRHINYGADPYNEDDHNGWAGVVRILFATWSLTIIHGACLALVAVSLPGRWVVIMAPLIAQWLVVTPFYLAIPRALIKRNITHWKVAELTDIEASLKITSDRADRATLAQRRKDVAAVKVNPYAGVVGRALHYLGILGTLAFVVGIIQYLY